MGKFTNVVSAFFATRRYVIFCTISHKFNILQIGKTKQKNQTTSGADNDETLSSSQLSVFSGRANVSICIVSNIWSSNRKSCVQASKTFARKVARFQMIDNHKIAFLCLQHISSIIFRFGLKLKLRWKVKFSRFWILKILQTRHILVKLKTYKIYFGH